MRPFMLKFVLYLLPFAAVFFSLSGSLVYIGEAMPLGMVVALQASDTPILYRPMYGSRDFDFKLLTVKTRHPEIMTIGSSRVLQFRSLFFSNKPKAFYNVGAPAWGLDTVDRFLSQLDDSELPRILIMGLDQPWFNDAFVEEEFDPPDNDIDHIIRTTASFLQDEIRGTETLNMSLLMTRREPLHGGVALGIRAIRDGHGFRNDGSEQYGDFMVAHYLDPAIERDRHMYFMETGEKMYVRGDHVSETRLQQLERILQRCQQNNVYVIGFLPPFTPTLYTHMIASGKHGYVPELQERLPALFERYGFGYFDFSNGEWLGANDTDFFDGWHASELTHIFLYLRMLEALPDVLGPYSDGNFLYNSIAQATDKFDVFGNRIQ